MSSTSIPKGYKQTEVGVIPEEWEVDKLSQCSNRITDGEHLTPLRLDAGYFLLSARNIHNSRLHLEDVDYVGKDEYLRIRQRCNPEEGDILISCSGSIGRVAMVPNGIECVLIRSAALIKPNSRNLSGLFAHFFLQSEKGQRQIFASLNQGAQANLFLGHIQELLCPLPPLPEQRAIAQVLSDTDALIGSLDKLIAKKKGIKQGAMQELLTGRRRVGNECKTQSAKCKVSSEGIPEGYKQTEVGVIPEEWEVKALGSLGSFSKGQGIRKDEASSGEIPCVRYGEIYTRHSDVIREYFSRISQTIAQTSKKLKRGDLLFAGSGETKAEIGKCVAFLDDDDVYAGGDIVILTPNNGDSYFMGYLLNSPEIVKQKSNLGQGDAVVHISATALSSVKIPYPPLAEQRAIAQVLSDMDAEIAELEERREKTKAMKQGLMQVLLTGKVRLV